MSLAFVQPVLFGLKMDLSPIITVKKVTLRRLANMALPVSLEAFGFPITLAFTQDGRFFFSERITGNLWEVKEEKLRLVKHFPIVPITGHHETGLLGIILDPNFEKNDYIYCFYTYGSNPEDFKNKVVRIKSSGKGEETLLEEIPAGWIHNGGIMAFGPDRTLYIGVGVNNEEKEKSQDINFLGGKVLRINPDGTIPEDNPFPDSPVYSYGHRNVFGLAFHPQTGKLYISDVGPDDNDEINIIEPGGNYGWPQVMGISDNPKFINPIQTYTPVITPTQNVFVGNDLYFGSFNQGSVHKLTLTGENFDQAAGDEIVYEGKPFGIIGVFHSPDDKFYITRPEGIQQISFGLF
jgi:glucose/arabinose dehydrogenase